MATTKLADRSRVGRSWLVAWMGVILASRSHAACDFIPGAVNQVLGAVGTLDRPFASPGAVVDVSAGCTGAAIGATAEEHVVTVVFLPPAGGDRSAVVLASDCTQVLSVLPACPTMSSGNACCESVGGLGEGQSGIRRFERDGRAHLRFRFPDTDAIVGDPTDNLTLTGPAVIAVSRVNQPLPLNLLAADASCRGRDDLIACVDHLFEADGNCPPATPDTRLAHFVALPATNDFRGVCATPGVCEPNGQSLRMTTDLDGNLLVPIDWRGVRVGDGSLPIARLLRGTVDVPAYPPPSPQTSLQLPGGVNVRSFSQEGSPLPPILDVQTPTTVTDGALVLFGATDGPASVLVILRRHGRCVGGATAGAACVADIDCGDSSRCILACVGGTLDGSACTKDGECDGGRCGRLFDFASRAAGGVGPVLLERTTDATATAPTVTALAAGGFNAEARDPAPLEGLAQSTDLTSIVISEGLVQRTLNADADQRDYVVQLAERATGTMLIGEGTSGRAITRIRQPPYSFPAVAVDGNVLAYLESEPAENQEDANGNGRSVDAILRVHERSADGTLHERTTDARAVDPAPVVDGRTFVLSQGRVFYRRSEAGAAARATVRASVGPNGEQLTMNSEWPDISSDGDHVTFSSKALLFPPTSAPTSPDFFVRNLRMQTTRLVTTYPAGGESGYSTDSPDRPARIGPDGTTIVFQSWSDTPPFGLDVFLRDLSQPVPTNVTAPLDPGGPDVYTTRLSASRNGRFVCALGDDLIVPNDTNDLDDIVVIDLATQERYVASLRSDGTQYTDGVSPLQCAISDDGRVIVFELPDQLTNGQGLVDDDTNGGWDIAVHDRFTGVTEIISRPIGGGQSNGYSIMPSVSADGRYVAFSSDATNLVPGDTNGAVDAFVYDRQTRALERVSLASDGAEGIGDSGNAVISADGGIVGFESEASNLVPGAASGGYMVHDRRTGVTERVDLSSTGAPTYGEGYLDNGETRFAMSGDGNTAAFTSSQALVPADTNGFVSDIYVRQPVLAPSQSELFPNGRLDDTVLEAFDAATGLATTLCPATAATVADGMVAFLRPEAATGGNASCPFGSLNEDGDTNDLVPHLWRGTGAAVRLCRSAQAIALSGAYVAVLVPDAAGGAPRVAVRSVASVDGSCSGWDDVDQPAERVTVCGSVVAFLTPESAAGNLNQDQDADDLVLQLYDPVDNVLVNTKQAASEIVCSEKLVAFRTPEAAQGDSHLNGDGDTLDAVLQAYDISRRECLVASDPPAGCLVSSERSAIPCPSEACDPRLPYRVLHRTVRFLTLESEEDQELTGDVPDKKTDLVLHILNVPKETVEIATHAAMGICTTSAAGCASDADCGGGTCFVPPGGCIRDTGVACDPADEPACTQGFCQPVSGDPGNGFCQIRESECASDAECTGTAICRVTGDSPNQLVAPIAAGQDAGLALTSDGRCVETLPGSCMTADQCAAGTYCEAGACRRGHGSCRIDADCGVGTCRPELLIATAVDRDHDETPDYLDNCPSLANADQADVDADGIGDACELCPPLPDPTCIAPAQARAARLRITDSSADQLDRLNFRWRKGAIGRADFGDPQATTSWALCLYDQPGAPEGALRFAAAIPPGGLCNGRPCWKVGSAATTFLDLAPTGNGIRKLALRAKPGLGGKLEVDGRGGALRPPSLISLQGRSVRAQVRSSSGTCWHADFPQAAQNDGVNYRAVSQ